MKTFNVAKSLKCQDEMRKILEAHELIYNLFLEFAKRSKTFDDNPAFTQSLQTALKLVRNKKITWTYGMFLKSTYDVFYLIDIFKELYTPEIQEKMDLVANYLTATIVVGGSERKKLFEELGEKENNPTPVYRKLDDVMWLQSLMQRYLEKVGASTNRDFLYKLHRSRKKRVLKRLKKKNRRTKAAAESEDESVVVAQDDRDSSTAHDEANDDAPFGKTYKSQPKAVLKRVRDVNFDEDNRISFSVFEEADDEDTGSMTAKQKIKKCMHKVKPDRDAECLSSGERASLSTFEEEEEDDDNDPVSVNKKIRTLEAEMDFDRNLNEDTMNERSPTTFGEDTYDPLAPGRRSSKYDPTVEFEDHKPDINILNKRLNRMKDNFSQPVCLETDPLDITHSRPEVPETERVPAQDPVPLSRPSDVMGESMASYIFSDSNMDIYSAQLADERRVSTSLTSMKNALSKISSSPQHKTRPFGVIDSILSKLNSNVSLLGKMNKRNVLSDQTVIWSNEKIKFPNPDELSRIDVILKLEPTLAKVGPINVYHKNRSYVYRCKIEDCSHFYTLSLDLLQRHVLAQHVHYSFSDWECTDCGYLRVTDCGIRGIMKHLSDSHSLEATSQIAVGRLKTLNESILKDIQSAGECPVIKAPGNSADACHLFQCCVPSCTYSTDSSVHAINHFNIKLDGRVEFTCKYCSTLVTTAYEYAKHLVKQHGECQYKCGYCFYRGLTKATIYFHQSFSHPLMAGKIFRCRFHAPFQDDRTFQEPKLKCNLVQCRCPHCRFNTTILEKFVRHLTEMHPYLGFPCFLCHENLTAPQRTGIIDHLLSHGIGEMQCLFCQQGFSTVTSARKHFSHDHPEKYPFVILRHDYFGKSLFRAQYSRTKEIALGFESILAVDLGSDSVCENQLQVIDTSGTDASHYEDIAKKFDYYFNPDRHFISLSDNLPKKAPLALVPVAQSSTSVEPKIKQTARKKTSPSPLKLVPLSKLVNEPRSFATNLRVTETTKKSPQGKETARKSTRPSQPTSSNVIPLPLQTVQKSQAPNFVAVKPSFTKPSAPVFKLKPNLGKVHSAYAPSVTPMQKKISVLNYKSPAVNPPVDQAGGAYVVPKKLAGNAQVLPKSLAVGSSVISKRLAGVTQILPKSTAGVRPKKPQPANITRLLKPTAPLLPKGSGEVKQTARKHTGGPGAFAPSPSTSKQPQNLASSLGSIDFKNVVRVINVSSRLPMDKAVSIIRKTSGPAAVAPQKFSNISINNPHRPSSILQIPMSNQEITIVPLPPKPKKRRDIITLDSD